MTSPTIAEINQLNIDLAELNAFVKSAVTKQAQHYYFAFGIYDAPSEKTELMSFNTYWELETEIQKKLNKIQKIKEKLR